MAIEHHRKKVTTATVWWVVAVLMALVSYLIWNSNANQTVNHAPVVSVTAQAATSAMKACPEGYTPYWETPQIMQCLKEAP